jgi:glutamyl/glutaminyl-tRNA synthetase
VCSKINVNSSGKSIPCYNSFVSNIVGLEKTYCPCHIRQAAKEYTASLKQKIKDEKEKQKEEKLKQKDEKEKQKVLQKAIDKEKEKEKEKANQKNTVKTDNIVVSQTNEIGVFVSDTSPQLCVAILKSGLRKGEECGLNGYNGNNMCKRHSK